MILGFESCNGQQFAREPTLLPNQSVENGYSLVQARVVKLESLRAQLDFAALGDDLLRKRMAHAVDIGVLDIFPGSIRAGIDRFLREWIFPKYERVTSRLEIRIRRQVVTSERPQPCLVTVEVILTLAEVDAELFMHFLVEIFEEFLARLLHPIVDLCLHIILKSVELELDLLFRATRLVDFDDPLLKIDARFDRAQHFIACPEDAAEKLKLFVKQLIDSQVSGVFLV